MPKVRVLDSNNNLVTQLEVEAGDLESIAQAFLADGMNVLVDSTPASSALTPQPFAVENDARAVVNQTLLDFHVGAQQLMALTLEQTRQWLALGSRVVDEDMRRRGLMHRAIADLDIADRSIAVLEWQGRMQNTKWAPEAANDHEGAGIVNLIGAVGKQLLDKKN